MLPPAEHSCDDRTLLYLGAVYGSDLRAHACRAHSPDEVEAWQAQARPALRALAGLERMERELVGHVPTVELGAAEDRDGLTSALGRIETEPGWWVEFWLLRPQGDGPFPLAVLPHGHEQRGHDTYAGVAGDSEHRAMRIAELDADVAVQAARRGFVAIAPNTRGFEPNWIPDLNERHGGQHCRSQLLHALVAGRTVIGERCWDLERIIDWASTLPEVDASRVLMMGNSGGGVATTYAAACDPRVICAVASCSFAPIVGANGLLHHCDCNAVPGILRFGDLPDVAGLIAPRHLLFVHGREDPLFPIPEVERAVAGVRAIYEAADASDRLDHRWGPAGHRFYADLMWPFVMEALGGQTRAAPMRLPEGPPPNSGKRRCGDGD